MKIYLVYGISGEGSDFQEWHVIAFKRKDHAEYYKKILTGFLLDHNIPNDSSSFYKKPIKIPNNPDDPSLKKMLEGDYGVVYGIEKIEYIE